MCIDHSLNSCCRLKCVYTTMCQQLKQKINPCFSWPNTCKLHHFCCIYFSSASVEVVCVCVFRTHLEQQIMEIILKKSLKKNQVPGFSVIWLFKRFFFTNFCGHLAYLKMCAQIYALKRCLNICAHIQTITISVYVFVLT